MARYVVLSFEDDSEAEKFVKFLSAAYKDTLATSDSTGEVSGHFEDAKVEGMMQKPTKFCPATGGCREGSKRVQGFFRGPKYGWWVCGICGKPTQSWATSLSAVLGCAVNLLRDRQSQNMERETANDVVEPYRTSRRSNIGRYPDGSPK